MNNILGGPNRERRFDNKVWFVDNAAYHGTQAGEWVGKRAYNNALVGLNVTMSGKTLEQWQAMNPQNDVGSTYKDVSVSTQADEIIAAARQLLSM